LEATHFAEKIDWANKANKGHDSSGFDREKRRKKGLPSGKRRETIASFRFISAWNSQAGTRSRNAAVKGNWERRKRLARSSNSVKKILTILAGNFFAGKIPTAVAGLHSGIQSLSISRTGGGGGGSHSKKIENGAKDD